MLSQCAVVEAVHSERYDNFESSFDWVLGLVVEAVHSERYDNKIIL